MIGLQEHGCPDALPTISAPTSTLAPTLHELSGHTGPQATPAPVFAQEGPPLALQSIGRICREPTAQVQEPGHVATVAGRSSSEQGSSATISGSEMSLEAK